MLSWYLVDRGCHCVNIGLGAERARAVVLRRLCEKTGISESNHGLFPIHERQPLLQNDPIALWY